MVLLSCPLRLRLSPALLLLLLLALGRGATWAEAPSASEYEVKAAFLYNFAKFVEWPPAAFADQSSALVIGVLGDDPFGVDLDRVVEDKTVNGRALVVRRFKRLEDLTACHILFVSASESGRLAHILDLLRKSSVLTVDESDQFVHLGGIINFTMRDSKVHFVINVDAAQQAGLKVSSKLLKVADAVLGQPGARQ
jgi:hypothetical protein